MKIFVNKAKCLDLLYLNDDIKQILEQYIIVVNIRAEFREEGFKSWIQT